MNKGYVYILTNAALQGLVKIGRTTKSPVVRAGQLRSTGVPKPFVVHKSVLSPNCLVLERNVHSELEAHRVDSDREFFDCTPDEAVEVLERLHEELVHEFTDMFLGTHVLVPETHFVDPSYLDLLAHAAGYSVPELVAVLGEVYASDERIDFDVLVQRFEARIGRRTDTKPSETSHLKEIK